MTVRDVVSEINVNGYYIMCYRVCVTLVTAKNIKSCNVRIRACVSRVLFRFLPCLAIARCWASSFSRTSSTSSLSSPSSLSRESSPSSPSSPSRKPPPLTSTL